MLICDGAGCLAGKPLMASRERRTLSRSWCTAVPGIRSSVGGSLSFSVLQHRSYSDEGLDGRVPPSASALDPVSGHFFSPAVPTTRTFGAHRAVYARNAYPLRKCEGFRVYGPFVARNAYPVRNCEGFRVYGPFVARNAYPVRNCEGFRVYGPIVKLSRTALNEDERPVPKCVRASRNVGEESCRDSPRRDFGSGKQSVPIGSGRGRGNLHLLPSGSVTSEAIAILKHRREQGLSIDSYMFVEILRRCSMQKDLMATRQVHEYIIQTGMQKHPYVATTLLNVYIKCCRVQEAHRVFGELERTHRNVITWNVMIGAYAKRGWGTEAYRLFQQMEREGFVPDVATYLSILNASASAGALEWVKEVHSHARRAGLDSDLRVGNSLVHMYAKSGGIDVARLVFDRMEKRNVITWTAMIGAYAQRGRGMEAYQLFLQMNHEGFVPDAFTYSSILNASASAGALEWVKEVHSHARRAGLESDLRVGNALVHMYAKSGSSDDARLAFDGMEKRDVVTWSTMIGAYAESGCGKEAYRLFLRMKREGFTPHAVTYLSILNASASAGALEWVKEVHSHARRAGLDSDLRVGNALVHMYAKSGSIDDARLVFDGMRKRDVVTWNTMLGGLAQHGCGHEALELFRNMIADSVKPDGASLVAVLQACCHAGLLADGRRLFFCMMQDYGIEPDLVHYTCMVDLLGRAGRLEEAKLFIGDMPVAPDGVTWKALLGACRTYGNVELGEFAAKEVLKLEPKEASAYVLLSNIYASAGEWEKVSSVRAVMQERGVAKEPGRSWIEIDDRIHEFVVGDTSHPESKAIYAELNTLVEKLKAEEGYIPDTQLVLRNIDEEDKELALCSHSEKLAIVYGLMRAPPEKPIRVYKNLRVCSDCHRATRLISKVTGREIIARDANRFHHFKDGVCSCGDYW